MSKYTKGIVQIGLSTVIGLISASCIGSVAIFSSIFTNSERIARLEEISINAEEERAELRSYFIEFMRKDMSLDERDNIIVNRLNLK